MRKETIDLLLLLQNHLELETEFNLQAAQDVLQDQEGRTVQDYAAATNADIQNVSLTTYLGYLRWINPALDSIMRGTFHR